MTAAALTDNRPHLTYVVGRTARCDACRFEEVTRSRRAAKRAAIEHTWRHGLRGGG